MTEVTSVDLLATRTAIVEAKQAAQRSKNRRRDDAGAREAGKESANRYKNMAADDESWEEFAEALTGKPASERTAEEEAMLDQLRQDILNGKISPEFSYADGEQDVLPADTRGAYVAPTKKGERGRVILKRGMSSQQRKETSDEEFGEAVAEHARSMGIDVADGDAGARGGIVVAGGTVTTETHSHLFENSPFDTVTVKSNGKTTTAAADAGYTTLTISFDEQSIDHCEVQVLDENGRWITVARSWVDGENDGSVTIVLPDNVDPSQVRVVNNSTQEIFVGGSANTRSTPMSTNEEGSTAQVMSWEDRHVGDMPDNEFNDVTVHFEYSSSGSPNNPTDLSAVDVFHNGVGYDLDTEEGQVAYFKSFDADGDGYLDHSELTAAMEFAGANSENIHPERIELLLKLYGGKRADGSWAIAVDAEHEEIIHADSGLSSAGGRGNGKGIDDMVRDKAIRRSDDGTTLQIDFNEVSTWVWAQAAIEFTAERRSGASGTTVTPEDVAETGITAFELDEFTDHFLGDWKAVRGDTRETLVQNFGILRTIIVDGTRTGVYTLKKGELADLFHAGGIVFRKDTNKTYVAIYVNTEAKRSFSSKEQLNEFLFSFAGDDSVLSEEELYQALLAAGMDPEEAAEAARLIVYSYGMIRSDGAAPTLANYQLSDALDDNILKTGPGGTVVLGSIETMPDYVIAHAIINVVAMQTGRSVEDVRYGGITAEEFENALNWLDGKVTILPGEAQTLIQMFGHRKTGENGEVVLFWVNLIEMLEKRAIWLSKVDGPLGDWVSVETNDTVMPDIDTQDELIQFLFRFDSDNDGLLDEDELEAGLEAYSRKTSRTLTASAQDLLLSLFGSRGKKGSDKKTLNEEQLTEAFTEGFLVMDPETGVLRIRQAGVTPDRVTKALLQSVADSRGVDVNSIEWVTPEELQAASEDVFGPGNGLTLEEAEGIVKNFGEPGAEVKGGSIVHGVIFGPNQITTHRDGSAKDDPKGYINAAQLTDSIEQGGFLLTPNHPNKDGVFECGFHADAKRTPPQQMTPAFANDVLDPEEEVYEVASYTESSKGEIKFTSTQNGEVQTLTLPAEVLEPNHEGSGIYKPPQITEHSIWGSKPRDVHGHEMHRSKPDENGNVTWTIGKVRIIVKKGSKLDNYLKDYKEFSTPSSERHNPWDPNAGLLMSETDPVTGDKYEFWAPRQHQFETDGTTIPPSTEPTLTVNGEQVTVTGMIVGTSYLDGRLVVGFETIDATGKRKTYFFTVTDAALSGDKGKAILAMAKGFAATGKVRDLSEATYNEDDIAFTDYHNFERARDEKMIPSDKKQKEIEDQVLDFADHVEEDDETKARLYDEGESLVEDGIMMTGAAMEAAGFIDPGKSDPNQVYFIARTAENEAYLESLGFEDVSGNGLVHAPPGGRRALQGTNHTSTANTGINVVPSVTHINDHQWERTKQVKNGRSTKKVTQRSNIRVKYVGVSVVGLEVPGSGTVRVDGTLSVPSGEKAEKFRFGIKATGTISVVVEGRFGQFENDEFGFTHYVFGEFDLGIRFNGRGEATVGAEYRDEEGNKNGNTRRSKFQSIFANGTARYRVYYTIKTVDQMTMGPFKLFYYLMNTLTGGTGPSVLVGLEARLKLTGGMNKDWGFYGRFGGEFYLFTIFASGMPDRHDLTTWQLVRRILANWPHLIINAVVFFAMQYGRYVIAPTRTVDRETAQERRRVIGPNNRRISYGWQAVIGLLGPSALGATWNYATNSYDQIRIGVTNLFDKAGNFIGAIITYVNRDRSKKRVVINADGRTQPNIGLPGTSQPDEATTGVVAINGKTAYGSDGEEIVLDANPEDTDLHFDFDVQLGDTPRVDPPVLAPLPEPLTAVEAGAKWDPRQQRWNVSQVKVTRLYTEPSGNNDNPGRNDEFKGFLVTHVDHDDNETYYVYDKNGNLRYEVKPGEEQLKVDGKVVIRTDGTAVVVGQDGGETVHDLTTEPRPEPPEPTQEFTSWKYKGMKNLYYVSWASGSVKVSWGDDTAFEDLDDEAD